MYKLIAVDLDGTLLNDEKTISDENLDLIDELMIRGYEVVIATGRRYWSAKELIKVIREPLVILANNGSVVRKSKNDSLLMTKYMGLEDYKILIKEGNRRGLNPVVHVDGFDDGYDIVIEKEKEQDHYRGYLSYFRGRYREVDDYLSIEEDKILAIVYAGDKENMHSFHSHIQEKHSQKYNSHVMENMQMAEALLEIMHPSACKWTSLLEYAKGKGIGGSEIITIGDDNNDAGMIKNAGCGIAMKNASQGVKQVADIITEKDNNDSGVAFELKKILRI